MRIRQASFHAALLGSTLLLTLVAGSADAKSFKVLHDFAGPPGDGSYPYNNVTPGAGGNIFGASNLGGSANSGTIFKIAKGGTETVLHSFDGGSGGSDPNGGVTLDPGGDIFGTTTFGGNAGCRNGCGVLYELAADGTFTVLHAFNPGADGQWPVGLLVRDAGGDLFGIASGGGPNTGGTIYEYSAKGSFTVLHAFGGSDGFEPQGNLVQDSSGNFYGVTNSGGADQYGTVFALSAKGTLTTLYSFTGGNDGGYPTGGVDRDKAGNLYGATNLAGNGSTPFGTVFKLAPGGKLTTLYAFAGSDDGGYPSGNVVLEHGKVYGTTTWGGPDEDGVVYAVDVTKGVQAVLHSFTGNDGEGPQAGLTLKHGRLYGAAAGGGADDYGVVFSMKSK